MTVAVAKRAARKTPSVPRARPVRRPGFVPPRFGTKRNLSRATYGGEIAGVSERLGKPFMPWQQYAADVSQEIDPATGELWYEEVIIVVPRQSGKTTLILAILLWRCMLMALRLGPQTCTYIAQSLKMARRKLDREFARLLRAADKSAEVPRNSKQQPSGVDEWKLSMNNGSEHILFGTDSYLGIDAPTELGGHGDVLDVSVTDEAWAREDDSVEQATDAATVTRRSPQSIILSTVGNRRSRYLARKVIAGRKCVDDPTSRTCYLEWSIADDEAFDDPKVWARRLPALGHTITVDRLRARLDKAMRNPDEVDEDGYEPGIAGFCRGYMNRWPEWPSFGGEADVEPEMDVAAWKAGARGSEIVGRVAFGVGVSRGGLSAAVAVAGHTAAGDVQVERIERAEGTWWLEKLLRERVAKWSPAAIGWDHSGDERMVAPDIQRASTLGTPPAELREINAADWKASCAAIKQRVAEHRVVHLEVEPGELTDAVEIAERQDVGDGWRWNVKGARADISLVKAMTAAMRALETLPVLETEQEPVFVYT